MLRSSLFYCDTISHPSWALTTYRSLPFSVHSSSCRLPLVALSPHLVTLACRPSWLLSPFPSLVATSSPSVHLFSPLVALPVLIVLSLPSLRVSSPSSLVALLLPSLRVSLVPICPLVGLFETLARRPFRLLSPSYRFSASSGRSLA